MTWSSFNRDGKKVLDFETEWLMIFPFIKDTKSRWGWIRLNSMQISSRILYYLTAREILGSGFDWAVDSCCLFLTAFCSRIAAAAAAAADRRFSVEMLDVFKYSFGFAARNCLAAVGNSPPDLPAYLHLWSCVVVESIQTVVLSLLLIYTRMDVSGSLERWIGAVLISLKFPTLNYPCLTVGLSIFRCWAADNSQLLYVRVQHWRDIVTVVWRKPTWFGTSCQEQVMVVISLWNTQLLVTPVLSIHLLKVNLHSGRSTGICVTVIYFVAAVRCIVSIISTGGETGQWWLSLRVFGPCNILWKALQKCCAVCRYC